ncbi:MAG: P1 family peptidase [Calditrichaeota bacterium]|nr:P1 family peptidase [Calditrichota bacterium]
MNSICDVPGIRVGHAQNETAKTGCTVVLCEEGAVGGVDLRGSAPGTRETELLRPGFLVQRVHAVVFAGGSAFGLDAAGGVQKFLEERGKGYDARGIRVPIVPSAVIFDLAAGDSGVKPDKEMGYQACLNARNDEDRMGSIGVGAGATVGKILGMDFAMPAGVGMASEALKNGIIVGVLVVVNALGDVVDPSNAQIVAGAKHPGGEGFLDTVNFMKEQSFDSPLPSENTTLSVVATNARFTKEEINKVAQMAQNGIGRTIRPAHTMYDGDLVFALSYGKKDADVNLVGEVAAELVTKAILRAVGAV